MAKVTTILLFLLQWQIKSLFFLYLLGFALFALQCMSNLLMLLQLAMLYPITIIFLSIPQTILFYLMNRILINKGPFLKQYLDILMIIDMQINTILTVTPNDPECSGIFDYSATIAVIIVSCVLGIIWAAINFVLVKRVNVMGTSASSERNLVNDITEEQRKLLIQLGEKIQNGAVEFLKQEYLICIIFVAVMFIVITFLTAEGVMTAIAFAIGAIISIVCGAVGMVIATETNFRTTYSAKQGLAPAFRVAFRAGCAMGFALVSLGLLVLTILIIVYKSINGNGQSFDFYGRSGESYKKLFEAIAGYGLGGSFVALFGRVGGGIYTKAADVGADLVGKIEKDLPEDSPKNPATIADNVGDNVGDVAGMSADLFGSFAESTCAALVLSSDTLVGYNGFEVAPLGACNQFLSVLLYPLLLIGVGIIVCILISTLSTHLMKVQTKNKIESTLKVQLIGSTIVLLGVTYLVCIFSYPAKFKIYVADLTGTIQEPYIPYLCSIFGLISGMIIAAFTEFVTSHAYAPVRGLADSCKAGAASNVTLGLALGYFSTAVPAVFIAVTAFFANKYLGYYGVALSALGMLSNLPLGLAIDGYGPISDNAGGIAEMAGMGEEVRDRTDALDAAGNTTAAIGKGFAIGSAALVSLSLFGGFLHNAGLDISDQVIASIALTKPEIFAGLIIGAMLPYVFSAFTIRSVGKAAFGMVEEVRRQLHEDPGILAGTSEPDYRACIRISTRSSLRQMIAPGCLVIFTPLVLGFAFGPKILAGFLPGAIVSGVQMAISAANTGGAWDNAKKYIESGAMQDDAGNIVRKGSDIHKAAVVGDTVGDPLKDTSGPALNILIKLMAIISLVFGSKFADIHN